MPSTRGATAPTSSTVAAVLALTFNAFVWGTSWLPFRLLQREGMHPLRATALTFAIAALLIAVLRPRALLQVARTPSLWVLVLAAGTTNAAFNWAIVVGDVVRVVLLFYLMPLWTILLARLVLGEPLTASAGLRVLLGFAGAAIVLWPVDRTGFDALPIPRDLAEGLGLLGGFSFAVNNVMLRREADRPEEGRALAMFIGGCAVAGMLSVVVVPASAGWPAPTGTLVALLLVVTALFLSGNLALQYGAARLPANRSAVVMLSEVLFASASSVLLGGASLTLPALAGGALIIAAAALAALEARPPDSSV